MQVELNRRVEERTRELKLAQANLRESENRVRAFLGSTPSLAGGLIAQAAHNL